MNNKIKCIVNDLDGTLLNSSREISAENLKAIRKVQSEGILFTICTGRIVTMMEYYARVLNITSPVVAANGALLWSPCDNKILFGLPMDPEEVNELFEYCRFYGFDYCGLTLEECYFSKNSVRIQRFLQYNQIAEAHQREKIKIQFFDDEHKCISGKDIYKVLISGLDEKQQELSLEKLKSLSKLGYTSSEEGLLDIGDKRASKGLGIIKLKEYLNLTAEEICAMGDFDNDIPMFEQSGCSIAMGNGGEKVKRAATYVTKSNDEDGVAWAIENYVLRD